MDYIISVFEDLTEITPTTIAVVIAVLAVVGFLAVIGPKARFNTKSVVYGGLCIAVAFILSYIRFYHWPQGGSITLASMLPMFVYAYIFGPAAGIAAGVAYGLLQLIQDPFILHPVQVLLDYIIAFGALGLAGYCRNNISLGVLLGGFGRFMASFLSGVIFFASYAPEGMNPIWYSMVVNGMVIGTDTAICFVISLIPQVRSMIERLRSNAI
ncbi:energy-coupled thiamine transporter ThiT [Mahella australiensis]|uniref:Proton-coupled thiamine transporter YuaJ n=1 Tax=Mahella australiensis (strain DSM 15567 / CIP 107919 / 50-1 BON) TaxID=697281 RepID=F3ZVS8_MAHA5|nr:energy-coupled thiamine transporter ThiT [Mahella australiensis]AEE97472.1 proton-coupled thiamine transporter YuaJ [Mahella australiensis 50-1 BON]